jgi:group I intron endonuclease
VDVLVPLNNNLIKESYLLLGVLPLKVYKDLTKPEKLKIELHSIESVGGGVYGLLNISDSTNTKQYIGSSKDLYQRLSDHLKGRDSNSRLQRSISKYGIEKFHFVIYYIHEDPAVILTDIETEVIKSFSFEDLYNYNREANSSLGYKHTIEAIEKMKKDF